MLEVAQNVIVIRAGFIILDEPSMDNFKLAILDKFPDLLLGHRNGALVEGLEVGDVTDCESVSTVLG